VAGANKVDFKMVEDTLMSIPVERPMPNAEKPQGICLDKGYDYPEVFVTLKMFGFEPHVRRRGEEILDKRDVPGYRARRWVVERSHSWINRFRRLLVRWEKKSVNYKAMLHLAFAVIIFQKSALLG
jgi:putative transposase